MRSRILSWALPAAFITSSAYAAPEAITKCPDQGRLEGVAGKSQWCVAIDLFGTLRKNGPFLAWHDNGRLRAEGQFVDDKRHGTWLLFGSEGQLLGEQRYKFGRLVSSVRHAEQERIVGVEKTEQRRATTTEEPEEIREPTAPRRPASSRDDFEALALEGERRNKDSGAIAEFSTDFAVASIEGMTLYRPGFGAALGYKSVALEVDWALAISEIEGQRFAAPLNPSFVLTYRMKHGLGDLSFGLGAVAPVRKIDFDSGREDPDVGGLVRLATYVSAPATRGFWSFWHSIPEVPTVVAPVHADVKTKYVHVDIEGAAYLPIPIHGGSSDLGLQLGADVSYPILEMLRAGARFQLVMLGVPNNADPIFGIEPFVDVALGPAYARAGLHFNVSKPDFVEALDPGLLWGFNMGIGVEI